MSDDKKTTDAFVHVGGQWLKVTLPGVSWFQPLVDYAHAWDEFRARLDTAFGPTDPTLESLLPPGAP